MYFFKRTSIILLIVLLFFFQPYAYAAGSDGPEVNAASAILVNKDTGNVIFDKNAYEKVYPASTTKVLTVLIIIDSVISGKYSLDDTFPADNSIYFDIGADGSTAHIQPGEIMSVRDYLYCALLCSANEACNALAIFNSGSVEAFVSEMNAYAESIGCQNSSFINTHGMPDENHYTTAYDMYLIFNSAMSRSLFCEICSSVSYTVPATNMSGERYLQNSNMMLNEESDDYYRYAVMGKTGTTTAAGSCLVSTATKNGQTLIAVVMGAEKGYYDNQRYSMSFSESKKLFEWGFATYSDQVILSSDDVFDIQASYSDSGDTIEASPSSDITAYVNIDTFEEDLQYDIFLHGNASSVTAPLKAGDSIGTITVSINGETVGATDLISNQTVGMVYTEYFRDIILNNLAVSIIIAVIVVSAIAVSIILIIRRKRRGLSSNDDDVTREELSPPEVDDAVSVDSEKEPVHTSGK